MTKVKSTAINELRYSARREELTIMFTDGTGYKYSGVPRNMFVAFKEAPSKGKFFNRFVREGYNYEKIS